MLIPLNWPYFSQKDFSKMGLFFPEGMAKIFLKQTDEDAMRKQIRTTWHRNPEPHYTRHARERMRQRGISEWLADIILDHGEATNADGQCLKFGLSKAALRDIRQIYGREVANKVAQYRRTYLVMDAERVVTTVMAKQPLFR